MAAIGEHELGEIVEQLTNMQEDKSRLRVLRSWASEHAATCDQCLPILATFFGLGDTREQGAVLLYPNVVDKDNWESIVLAKAFIYPEERQGVKDKLGLK